MGWANGSYVADELWDAIKKHIPKEKRQKVALAIVNVFEDADCDTMAKSVVWLRAGLSEEDEEDEEDEYE